MWGLDSHKYMLTWGGRHSEMWTDFAAYEQTKTTPSTTITPNGQATQKTVIEWQQPTAASHDWYVSLHQFQSLSSCAPQFGLHAHVAHKAHKAHKVCSQCLWSFQMSPELFFIHNLLILRNVNCICRWTRSNWAFLNEPPETDFVPHNKHRYATQIDIAARASNLHQLSGRQLNLSPVF